METVRSFARLLLVCCWRVVCCPSLCQRLSILVPEKTWWVSTDWPIGSSVTDCAGTALCAGATVTTRSCRHRWWTCPHHRPTVFYTHKLTVRNCLCSVCLCSARTKRQWEIGPCVLFVCVLHTQYDGENCLCSVCVLHTHDSENCLCSVCLCSAHTAWRWELSVFCAHSMTVRIVCVLFVCVLHTQHDGENCLCSVHTAWPLKLSDFSTHNMAVRIVCVLHTQHDGDNLSMFCTLKMAVIIHCVLHTENNSKKYLCSAYRKE